MSYLNSEAIQLHQSASLRFADAKKPKHLEVEEFVLEDEGDYGVYLKDGQIRKSPTSELSYSWGTDKNIIRTQYIEPGVREVNREWKRRLAAHEKPLSQDEAISIAFAAIKKHKEQYTGFGREMHSAFQAFDEGKPVNLPTLKHQAFFQGFLYFRKQHEVKPIFIEKFVSCPHCELSTQIDNFSEVDGLNTIMDYKTGRTIGYASYQLAIYKHVLENLGYTVHRTWAVHVQDFFAFPIETNEPWENVELRLKNAELKRKTLNPKTYAREFAGRENSAEKKEPDITSNSLAEQSLAPETNSQGHQHRQEVQEPYTTLSELDRIDNLRYALAYPGPEDKSPRETGVQQSQPVRKRGRPRKDSQHTSPSANTSSRKADSRQQTPPEEVELEPTRLKRAA